MKQLICACTLVVLVATQAVCQDTIPMLKGKVDISVTKGTFSCDLTLSHFPNIDDYYIRLNSGMNIRYMRNPDGLAALNYDKSLKDTLATGEANAWYIGANNSSGKYLPQAVEINYTGMFPVIADTVAAVDWKGNIAFNGRTVRTDGSQTAWYPVLYDVTRDKRYDKVTYDLEFTCSDCKVIYVNGSEPVSNTYAHLKSDAPQELTLFCGNYRVANINGTYFLNPDITDEQLGEFEKTVRGFKEYYEQHLQIPYKGNAVYIQTTPVSKNNSWLFATYPSIVNINFEGMKEFVDRRKTNSFRPYMAHELGHYYFGKYRTFNSEMGDLLSEGFAEYLAMKVTKEMISDSLYKDKIRAKLRALRNFKPIAFSGIHSPNDYHDRELYVYYYSALIFTAIEKEIGEESMWKWIRLLLQTPARFTNYTFIKQTLSEALHDQQQLEQIRNNYFTGDKVIEHVAAILGEEKSLERPAPLAEQKSKTVYFFLIAKPMIDKGSPENRVVKHTVIKMFTGTEAEISKMVEPLFAKLHESCENKGGCSGDFNTYHTMEDAKAALERWLKPFTGNPRYKIQTLDF